MDNRKLTVEKVTPFLAEAEKKGCYTAQQVGNVESIWKQLSMKLMPEAGMDPAKVTVEELQSRLEDLFNKLGATSDTSYSTVKTYQARVKGLLLDFIKWNGADFMAWKEANAKTGRQSGSARVKRPKPPIPVVDISALDPALTITHQLRLPGARMAELRIPSVLSAQDIDRLWRQLDALKTLVVAQAAVDDVADAAGDADA